MWTVALIFILCIIFIVIYATTCEKFTQIPSSVVIVGCAKNIANYLPNSIEVLRMIRSCFMESRVIIYENDSNDDTLNILENFAKDDKRVEIISQKNVRGLRTQVLSHGRNILLQKALSYKPEYLVVMDMDIINLELTKKGFLSSFDYNFDWAAMFANQKDFYYDIYALRTLDDWLNFDFHLCLNIIKDYEYCVQSRSKKIDENNDPIQVHSAFGGLGIYKTKYIPAEARYYGGENENEECEHVPFNKKILGKLFINPKMLNSSGKDH